LYEQDNTFDLEFNFEHMWDCIFLEYFVELLEIEIEDFDKTVFEMLDFILSVAYFELNFLIMLQYFGFDRQKVENCFLLVEGQGYI
jgi:hypothetical protein